MSWLGGLLTRWLALGLALARRLIGGLLGAPLQALAGRDTVAIRRCNADDLLAVRHAVLRAGLPEATARFDGDQHPATRHWAAERLGVVIGCVTVVDQPMPAPCPSPAPTRQLRGMAVLPDYRGQGVGHALLAQVHAEEAGPLWCNARANAVAFYAQHGWRPIGEPFEIAPIGPHQRMTWAPPA